MVAFRHAIELGADGIELDVRMTADGGLVVFHDELLHRTTSGTGAPCERDLAYVRSLDAGAWFDPSFEGERVPLLEEVLSLKAVEFEIELKDSSERCVTRVMDQVLEHDVLGRAEFTSWNLPMLLWLKDRWPTARLGLFSASRSDWMTDEVYERSVLAPLPYGAFDVVHVSANSVTPGVVEQLHRLGKVAHANDATDRASVRNALATRSDRLSTDDVELARRTIDVPFEGSGPRA
jgi:glycerophosphoryl diester phosphodiesterase